jgi:hypothetical protein
MALVRAHFNACPDRKRNAAERLNTLIRVSSCPIDPCYVLTRDGFVARKMRNMSNAPYSGFDPALTVVLAEAFDRAWSTVESSGVATVVNGGAEAMRRSIALRIVTMADQGLTNVTELAMDALSHVTEQEFPEGQERLAARR